MALLALLTGCPTEIVDKPLCDWSRQRWVGCVDWALYTVVEQDHQSAPYPLPYPLPHRAREGHAGNGGAAQKRSSDR